MQIKTIIFFSATSNNYITTIYEDIEIYGGISNYEFTIEDNKNYLFFRIPGDRDLYYIFCKKCNKLICVWSDDRDWSREYLYYFDEGHECISINK